MVQLRREKGLGTRIRDIVSGVEGQAVVCRGMEAVQKQQAQEKLKTLQQEGHQTMQHNGDTSTEEEGGGICECMLDASVLTRKM